MAKTLMGQLGWRIKEVYGDGVLMPQRELAEIKALKAENARLRKALGEAVSEAAISASGNEAMALSAPTPVGRKQYAETAEGLRKLEKRWQAALTGRDSE